MSDSLLMEMREQRLRWIEAGGHRWLLFIPYQRDAALLLERIAKTDPNGMEGQLLAMDEALAYLRDWEGITEGDLLGNGAEEPVAFDREIALEYLADHLGEADEIARELFEAIRERSEIAEKKKSALRLA